MLSTELLGLLIYSLSTVCVSGISILAKLAGEQGLSVMLIALVRGIVVTVLNLPALVQAQCNPFGNNRRWLIVRGIVGWLSGVLMYATVQLLPLAEATVLSFLAPLWAAIGCKIFLKEPPPKIVWVCLPVCLAAVVLVARPPTFFGTSAQALPALGVILGCMQGMVSASVRLVVRHLRHTDVPPVIIFYQGMAATILSPLLMLIIPGQRRTPLANTHWLLLLGIGLVGYGNQITLTFGLKYAQASTCSALAYLSVVWALLAGIFLFHENLQGSQFAGVAVIMVCTLCVAWGQKRVTEQKAAEASLLANSIDRDAGSLERGVDTGITEHVEGSRGGPLAGGPLTAGPSGAIQPARGFGNDSVGWFDAVQVRVLEFLGMGHKQHNRASVEVEAQPLLHRTE